jgi:hypothetical protein
MNIETKKYIEDIENKYKSIKGAVEKDKLLSFYQIHNISYKENYHSKFIAFFLNPKKHEFDQEFLNNFIKMLGKHIPDNNNNDIELENPFSCENVITDRGKKIDHKKLSGGRVDIGILNINPDKHIIIENKINSIDQPAQLERYKKMKDYKNATIVYLNLSGKPASSNSLGNIKDNEYIILSYKHIIDWIEDCKNYFDKEKIDIKEGIANKIYFFLNDYLTVVKEITKTTEINDAILPMLSEDIHFFFKTHDDVIKIKKNNKNAELSVFQKLCLNKVVPLKQYLIKEKFINIILNNLINDIDIGEGLLFTIKDKDIMQRGWGFQFYKEKWKKYNIKIEFQFMRNNLRNCIFGLRKYDPDNPKIPEYLPTIQGYKTQNGWYYLNKENRLGEYSNWFRKTFYDFMSDDTKETPFYKLIKGIVLEMCKLVDRNIIK